MPKIALAVSIVIGLAAIVVVYLAFLAHEFVKAGRLNVALGEGVFFYVAARPAFLIAAAVAFALVLYTTAR
jgi:hypothetical protein